MNKKDIVDYVHEECGIDKGVVDHIITKCFDRILYGISGQEKIDIKDFGYFESQYVPADVFYSNIYKKEFERSDRVKTWITLYQSTQKEIISELRRLNNIEVNPVTYLDKFNI